MLSSHAHTHGEGRVLTVSSDCVWRGKDVFYPPKCVPFASLLCNCALINKPSELSRSPMLFLKRNYSSPPLAPLLLSNRDLI